MNLILIATAAIALFSPGKAPLSINVDVNNGDTISGSRTIRVTVDSSTAINQVEFYVNDDLRDTETSTPYLFPFDTVNEADGDLKLRFKAYTTANQTSEKVITVHIDNEKSKGADFHVKAGQDALVDSKWNAALDQGRIALKIDPSSNAARIVLARANLGLNTLDKAQKYAEDAVAQDPKDVQALQILASVDVHRAFNISAKEGADRTEVVNSIGDALKGAVDARKKSLDLVVDNMGEPTDATLLAYCDAALKDFRYSLVIEKLQDASRKDPKNNAITDRLVYAQLLDGRYAEGFQTLKDAQMQSKLDAYGDALLGIAYIQLNDDAASLTAMKAATEEDPDNLGVRTAQAYIALKQNKTAVFSGLAKDLGKDEGQRPDVAYFLMALSDRQQRFSESRRLFERGILAEPAFIELYIEQANYNIALAQDVKSDTKERDQNYQLAKIYFQTALNARPEATDALAGLAVVSMLQKNSADAVKYAEAARDSAQKTGIGHFVAAGAYELAGRFPEAVAESKKAGVYDKVNLLGREIPDGLAVWRYLNSGGRTPVISAPQ